MFEKMGEEGSPAGKKPKFRYHKNLATSRYDEFLAESDDEDFFRSKPRTKDGRDYELDFKIDTFRNEIKLNKNGSTKMLLGGRNYSDASKLLAAASSNDNVHVETNESQNMGDAYADYQPSALGTEFMAEVGTDPELAAAQLYLHSLGGRASVERYK